MRQLSILAIAVAAAASPFAFAQSPQAGGVVATAPGKAMAAQTVKATATVEKVDKATRTVTLKMPNGSTRSVVAGDEVRNFDQIKVGDEVNIVANPSRVPGELRALMVNLTRPSDGFSWGRRPGEAVE